MSHNINLQNLPKKLPKKEEETMQKPDQQRFFEKLMVYDVPLGAGRTGNIMTRGPPKVKLNYHTLLTAQINSLKR